jgi:uncharacterized membrane protein (DUF2068 family)
VRQLRISLKLVRLVMERERSPGMLLAIAIFKLVKAATLLVIGVTALLLAGDSTKVASLERIAEHLKFGPNNHLVDQAISAVSGLDAKKLAELGVGTFVYAAVFLTEGTGLLLRKRWAEYLTTIVTASFVPFEIYELVKHASPIKVVGLVVNIAIVIYLLARLLAKRSHDTPNVPNR